MNTEYLLTISPYLRGITNTTLDLILGYTSKVLLINTFVLFKTCLDFLKCKGYILTHDKSVTNSISKLVFSLRLNTWRSKLYFVYNNSAESLRIREEELEKKYIYLAGNTGIPNNLLRWKFYKVNLLQVSSTKILLTPESEWQTGIINKVKGVLRYGNKYLGGPNAAAVTVWGSRTCLNIKY